MGTAPNFQPMSVVAKRSPISATAEHLFLITAVIVTVQSLIADEEKRGIDRSRIVVGGFSQGGAVALYSSFTIPQKPVAGIVGLSTWLPMHKTFPAVRVTQSLLYWTPVAELVLHFASDNEFCLALVGV